MDVNSESGLCLMCTPRLQKPALSWQVWGRPCLPSWGCQGLLEMSLHFKILHCLSDTQVNWTPLASRLLVVGGHCLLF